MIFRFTLCILMINKIFAGNTIRCTNIFRNAIISDQKMPSIYLDKNFYVDEKLSQSIYSIEHILPRSYLNKKDHNDMHNIIKTINNLNVNRSNYKYIDSLTDDKNWIKLEFENYVNHKQKLFIPNTASKGFISRALLYMCKEYDYNILKIIDKDTLLKWYFNNPPKKCEQYHNLVIKKLQNKNNIFISNYNKKTKKIIKFLESI